VLAVAAAVGADPEPKPELPLRVRRIVLHVPGGPSYHTPARRFVFFTPQRTQALWSPSFGAHWIVWTDGSLWPRRPPAAEAPSWMPPEGQDAASWRRLAAEAAPVYSHVHGANSASIGIEVAHSGRRADPFPDRQLDSVAWLLRSLLEMSGGRLRASDVVGHKDLDPRPAFVYRRCQRSGCPVYVDDDGKPFRRRVDPPEHLFDGLAARGLRIPRPDAEGDFDLIRAEGLPSGRRPVVGTAR
jgi:hypothetical protein